MVSKKVEKSIMPFTAIRVEEDGRNWLRRPKFCIESCRAVIIRRRIDTNISMSLAQH
jgi:hypothetical protein